MPSPEENKLALLEAIAKQVIDDKIKVDNERLGKELDLKPLAAQKRWDRYKADLKKATVTAVTGGGETAPVVVPRKPAVKVKGKKRAPAAAEDDDTVDEEAAVDESVTVKKGVRRTKKAKVDAEEEAEEADE